MDCIGNHPLVNNQVEERVEPPWRGSFKGSRSKASPTFPSVSERIGEERILLLSDRGGSLEGFTPGMGNKNWGWASKLSVPLPCPCISRYHKHYKQLASLNLKLIPF